MRLIFLFIAFFILFLPGIGTADTGRYEAVIIPEAGRSGQTASLHSRVFIVDTAEGHLWTWSENEAIFDEQGKPQFGAVLIYQGKVRPGQKPGDVIEKRIYR